MYLNKKILLYLMTIKYNKKIIKSKNDKGIYKCGTLKNKIKYVVCQDEQFKKSNVCVSVNVGSLSDPIEYQGLAHFLEHMLFLGSKKYPKENYFDKKSKEKGSSNSNAATCDSFTEYYFNVMNNNLFEMLDVFSRFFIDPLFDENSVNREINAVNSEHMKNINNDMWSIFRLQTLLSKKNSDISKFSTGNLETLNKKGIRNAMINFYNDYYCSDRITISIVSSLDVNIVQNELIKIFSLIKYKKSKKITMNKPYFNKKPQYVQYIPNEKMNQLIYFFEIPDLSNFRRNKEMDLIYSIFTNRKEGSLIYLLKLKGLIEGMEFYIDPLGIASIYIDLLRDSDKDKEKIQSYLLYFFRKIQNLNWNKILNFEKVNRLNDFEFKNTVNGIEFCRSLSKNLHSFPFENILDHYWTQKMDVSNIKKIIKKHLNPENFYQIVVSSKKNKSNYIKDKYYNFKYTSIPKIKAKEKSFDFNIDLTNIIKTFNPILSNKISKKYLIPNEIQKRVWYGGSSKFNEYIVHMNLIFQSHDFINDPLNFLMYNILLSCINYYITCNYYQEIKLGYSASFSSNDYSILLNIYCYNDNFKVFYEDVIKYIKNLKIDKVIFKLKLNEFKDSLKNIKKKIPWEYLDILIYEKNFRYDYSDEVLLNEFKNLSFKKLNDYKDNIFNKSLQIFCYGNIDKNKLPDFKNFEDNLKIKIPNKIKYSKSNSFKIIHPNKKEKNNCVQILYYCYSGFKKYKKILLVHFVRTLTSQPFYDKLRTKEQLGYLVNFGIKMVGDKVYFSQKIQSEFDVNTIIKKINSFNKTFFDEIKNMSTKDWNNWKNILKEELNISLDIKKTSVRHYNYINEIISGDNDFNKNKNVLEILNDIKLNDVIKYYKDNILNSKYKSIMKIVSQKNV
jgi:insulysin